MDLKYKIVLFLFILIVILYMIYFLTSWMHAQKRKETFQNEDFIHQTGNEQDNEKHVYNSHKNTSNNDYTTTSEHNTSNDVNFQFRMKVLEIVDQLNITDKTVKTNLIDYLFSDPVKNDIINKSDDDIKTFIKSAYSNMSGIEKTTHNVDVKMNHGKEHFDDKIDTLINYVTNLLNGLKDLKNTPVKQESIIKETTKTNLISPPRPEDALPKIKQEKIIEKYDNNISGIEHTKQFAFF